MSNLLSTFAKWKVTAPVTMQRRLLYKRGWGGGVWPRSGEAKVRRIPCLAIVSPWSPPRDTLNKLHTAPWPCLDIAVLTHK